MHRIAAAGLLLALGLAVAPWVAAVGQENDDRSVLREFGEAYRAEDWSRAAELGRELARRHPDRPISAYNLACVLARSGDEDEALEWLRRAAELGFDRVDHLDADADLEALRAMAGFAAVRTEIAANLERRRAVARRHAESSPLLVVTPESCVGERTCPVVVVLHGYGDRPDNHPPHWTAAARDLGAILAFPEGPERVGDGRGWIGLEEADVIVESTLARLQQDFPVDRHRIVIAGFSQGGYLAAALGIRHRNLVRGVVAVAGPYVAAIDGPPPARTGDPRVFFLVGSRDPVASQVRQAAADFEAAGFATRLRVVPGLGHALPRSARKELGRALEFVLADPGGGLSRSP